MNHSDIVERIVVSYQLQSGVNPTEVLVRHYDGLCRNVVASDSRLASEYREARDIVALVRPQFFVDVAKAVGASLESVIDLFRDSRVVKFFQKIGWKLERFWKVLKDGYSATKKFVNVLSQYAADTKVMKWTEAELKKLDEWLGRPENRRAKMLAGIMVGEMIVYLWFLAADTGHIAFDLDLSDATAALSGSYSLADIFAGPEGVKWIAILAAGAVGLSFPWPGPMHIRFVAAVITTISLEVKRRLKPAKKPVEQEAQELGIA